MKYIKIKQKVINDAIECSNNYDANGTLHSFYRTQLFEKFGYVLSTKAVNVLVNKLITLKVVCFDKGRYKVATES